MEDEGGRRKEGKEGGKEKPEKVFKEGLKERSWMVNGVFERWREWQLVNSSPQGLLISCWLVQERGQAAKQASCKDRPERIH